MIAALGQLTFSVRNDTIALLPSHAGMMELVDMRDLGSRGVIRWGSSPHARTMRSVLVGFEDGCNILKCRTLQKLTTAWDWE